MKSFLALLCILTFSLCAVGQAEFQQMVDADRSLANLAVEKDTKTAYMQYLADDAIIFRPDAVNGKVSALHDAAAIGAAIDQITEEYNSVRAAIEAGVFADILQKLIEFLDFTVDVADGVINDLTHAVLARRNVSHEKNAKPTQINMKLTPRSSVNSSP